jgi:hypothetical protein
VLRDGLSNAFSDSASGWHREDLVTKFEIGREAQDCVSAPNRDPTSKRENMLKLNTNILDGGVPIGADRDPTDPQIPGSISRQ